MKTTRVFPAPISGLLLLLGLLAAQLARAQPVELPPEVRIMTYTNETYSYRLGSQDWTYPEGNRHGSGFAIGFDAARYSRTGGGLLTNYSAWNSAESGYGGGGWNHYSESRLTTTWGGPCPAPALAWNYWTNSLWWEGMTEPWSAGDQYYTADPSFTWEPPEARQAYAWENVPWTLLFNSGPPHQGYFETWNGYTLASTTLELFAGGPTNSTEDVTIKLNVWAYDNLRQRYLTWNELRVNGRELDTNRNAYFQMQDNQRMNLSFTFTPTNGLPAGSLNGYDYSFGAWPVRDFVRIGVDRNRDGGIDLDGTNDLTTATAPHVFWINDDNDTYDSILSDLVDANGAGTYSWDRIVNARDLEDFERLAIRLPSFAYYDATATWGLRLTAPTALKLFANASDSRTHVESSATATALTQQFIPQGQPGCYLGEANPTLTLPDWMVNQALQSFQPIYCLFEARTAGTGALQVELLRNGDVVGRAKVHLKLRPITEMYDHFTAGDTTAQGVIPASTAQQIGTCQLTGLDDDYILFVHGWRMEPWERRRFAETAFKRLWWQGYKGRFGLFSWPTEYSPVPFPPGNFQRSELQAWRSGEALRKLLKSLNAGIHHDRLRLFAHSMGNVVCGEALRQLTQAGYTNEVHSYAAMQGALASHCYDFFAPVRTLSAADSGTRNLFAEYPNPYPSGQPYLDEVKGARHFWNFLNRDDFALNMWKMNQDLKPGSAIDGDYQWTRAHLSFLPGRW